LREIFFTMPLVPLAPAILEGVVLGQTKPQPDDLPSCAADPEAGWVENPQRIYYSLTDGTWWIQAEAADCE
jgi:hypothetical protein